LVTSAAGTDLTDAISITILADGKIIVPKTLTNEEVPVIDTPNSIYELYINSDGTYVSEHFPV